MADKYDIDFIANFITEDPTLFNEMLPVSGVDPLSGKAVGQQKAAPRKLSDRLPSGGLVNKEPSKVMDPKTGQMQAAQPTTTSPASKYPKLDKAVSSPVVDKLFRGNRQFVAFFNQIMSKLNTREYSEDKAIMMIGKAVEACLDRLKPESKATKASIIAEEKRSR